jgi:hypothetical protein
MPDSGSGASKRQGHHVVKSVGAAAPVSTPAPAAKATTQSKPPKKSRPKKPTPVKKVTTKNPMKKASLAALTTAVVTVSSSGDIPNHQVLDLIPQGKIILFLSCRLRGICCRLCMILCTVGQTRASRRCRS